VTPARSLRSEVASEADQRSEYVRATGRSYDMPRQVIDHGEARRCSDEDQPVRR